VLSNTNDKMGAGGWDSAIDNIDGGGASGNNVYTNNLVHDNWGEGQTLADDDVARANTYYDNWSAQVFLEGTRSVTIEKNLIYTTYRQRPAYARQLGTGIGFADETSPARSSSNVVRNNIIENVGTGMYYWNSGTAGTGLKHDEIDNNTVVNTWNCGLCFDAAAHTGTLLRDNLVVPRSGTVAAGTTASGISAAGNLFTTRGSATDPHLASEGTFSFGPDGYRLTGASVSAIDRGVASSAADDYSGRARPQGARSDIGAFERY
jgi:Right handed beta helix region